MIGDAIKARLRPGFLLGLRYLLDSFEPVARLSSSVSYCDDYQCPVRNGRHDVERKALERESSHEVFRPGIKHRDPGIRKTLRLFDGRFKGIEKDQAEAVALLVVPFAR